MPIAIGLYAHIKGYVCEVLLNGVPLVSSNLSYPTHDTVPVTEWIVNGSNEFKLVIQQSAPEAERVGHPPLEESVGEDLVAPFHAHAEIVEGELGEVPDPEFRRVIAKIDFQPTANKEWQLPFTVRETFQLAGRPTWSWQGAEVVNPADHNIRAEIIAFLRAAHDDLVRQKVDEIIGKLRPKIEDAPGMGITSAEGEERLRRSFHAMVAQTPWVVSPFDDDDVGLRACAGGRVIHVESRTDGESVLRSGSGSGAQWKLPVWLSRLNGAWALVR